MTVFVADRLTKTWAAGALARTGSISVLPFFRLTYAENTGAAFSLLFGQNRLFLVVSLVLLSLLIGFRRRIAGGSAWSRWGVALVIGGALGNLYDRITLGHVVDFMDFIVWPIFNVADSCISAGAVMLAIGLRQVKSKK